MILRVKFYGSQHGLGEDLYRGVETGKIYIRQESNVKNKVFWLSSTKWQGGYEANCPLEKGITVHAQYGEFCFNETLEEDAWNNGTSSKKKFLFSWEIMKLKLKKEFGEEDLKNMKILKKED